MRFKKVLFFLTAIVVLVLSACSQKPAEDEKNEIVIWHWMTDRQTAFKELAKKYEEQTGVKIGFKLIFPPDIYSQKVIAAARAETLPDIFGILGEKRTLGSFIRAGYIVNLNSYMEANQEEWKERFYPQTLKLLAFPKDSHYDVPPGIYGVPIDTTIMQFVYNRSLFKEAGLVPDKYPETFEEFIAYTQTVKEKTKVNGFVCGWGEGWLLNCLATEWAINLMGEDKFFKTIKGEVPYTDKEWIEVFSLFSKLKDEGILVSNIATMTNKESESAFSRGKAVFSFNGSWAVNVYKQLSPDLDYAFFPLPKVSSRFPVKTWGGAGSSFMVSAKSSREEEAIKFLNWFTSEEQQKFLIRETNNFPAIKDCEEYLPQNLKSSINVFSSLTHPDVWPYSEDSRVIEVLNKGLQQIVMDLKTPQEVALEIQRKKEKISRK